MIYFEITVYFLSIFHDNFVVVMWYMFLMMMLYVICGITVMMVMFILFMKFDYWLLIMFEFYTLVFFFLVGNAGSSYERGSANTFIMVFGFVLGFGVVMSNNMMIIRFVLLILGLAKLPMYGLHVWLPKVHVEASIMGSMVLAGAVLKLGIIYVWNFGGMIIVRVVLLMSVVVIYSVVDGK